MCQEVAEPKRSLGIWRGAMGLQAAAAVQADNYRPSNELQVVWRPTHTKNGHRTAFAWQPLPIRDPWALELWLST